MISADIYTNSKKDIGQAKEQQEKKRKAIKVQ